MFLPEQLHKLKCPAANRRMVWEVVGISRIERVKARLSSEENWFSYRCYNASGELVFEATDMHETIFKYRFFFDQGGFRETAA